MTARAITLAAGLLPFLYPAGGTGVARSSPLGACRMTAFTVALGPGISEATGQHTLVLRLRNRGAFSCVLDGYPKVTGYDHAGLVPFSIRHGSDQMIRDHRPRRFVVRSGGVAWVALNHYRCDVGSRRVATRVRIGMPGATPAKMTSIMITHRYRQLDYCGRGDPGSTLTVSPFEPTLRAAFTTG